MVLEGWESIVQRNEFVTGISGTAGTKSREIWGWLVGGLPCYCRCTSLQGAHFRRPGWDGLGWGLMALYIWSLPHIASLSYILIFIFGGAQASLGL